jgi:type I restriction enzyme S subunit
MELKPGYKQTEVGVIPEEWGVVTASDACSLVVDCKNRTPPIVDHSEYAVVRTPNVRDGRFIQDDLRFTDESSYREWTARAVPQAGDIMITREAPLGEVCAVPDAQKVCLGQRMMLYRPSPSKTDSRYLLYSLMSLPVRANLMRKIGGSTVGHAKVDDIRFLKLPLPPLPEQRAIASLLSDTDSLLASLEQLIAKKLDIKQAAMQELLTGKRRLPGFEGEWEVTTVRDVVSRHFCGPSPTCEERNIEGDHEWGVLKTTAITWENGWSWKAHKLLPPSYWGKTDIELKKGDVLVTKAGPRHRVGVSAWVDHVPSRIIPSGKMIALRLIPKKAEPLMLAAAIASRETQIFLDQRTTGMAESQVNFENSVLLAAPISLPSVAEQTAISEICRDFDEELQDLEKKAATLLRLKEGMMQQLLTGKIRLA